MANCKVQGCSENVAKAEHIFCLEHWKAERNGDVKRCEKCQQWHDSGKALCGKCDRTPVVRPAAKVEARPPKSESPDDSEATVSREHFSSTRLAEHFGLTAVKINLILAELGWIEKYVKGWVPTDRGNRLGANVRQMRNGTPFVVWPESILRNVALVKSIHEQSTSADRPEPQRDGPASVASADASANFRSKFLATLRTQDGHLVRSRAELLIDNWLYVQKIVHAYERRLPIEEECYCDFYLPDGKGVYIEFWGMESAKYKERKVAKQGIYAKYQMRLIELGDAEIERLDDVLPRLLLKFGIETA